MSPSGTGSGLRRRIARNSRVAWQPSRAWLPRRAALRKRLWLRIDEVVHHRDVVAWAVVRAQGTAAVGDPHTRHHWLVPRDAQEREAAGRKRRLELAQGLPVFIEVLERRVVD